MECKQCNREIIKSSPKVNNVKFCSGTCRNKFYYIANNGKERQREIAGRFSPGKVECKLCGRFYHKIGAHVFMSHKLKAREYRKMIGEFLGVANMSPKSKELARKRVFENPECISENLIEKGKQTRIKKGDKLRTKKPKSIFINNI